MMPFDAFRRFHLDWRVNEGTEVFIRAAADMALAYRLLCDDKEERRKAQEFRAAQMRKVYAAAEKTEGGES